MKVIIIDQMKTSPAIEIINDNIKCIPRVGDRIMFNDYQNTVLAVLWNEDLTVVEVVVY